MLDDLTFEQLRLVLVVYSSALLPLVLIPLLNWRRIIPTWVLPFYFKMFLLCAIGWEIWFTYGLVGGDDISVRRADVLNQLLPIHLNWLLNSLADAGAICCGSLLLIWLVKGRPDSLYNEWNWSIFLALLVLFISQNIVVELFLYHDQLAEGKLLSWAPLSPFGSWFNPALAEFNGRSLMLCSQLPWLLLTPLIYLALIRTVNSSKEWVGVNVR
tara:strand:- start:2721 stop:3362 length:642 start_codon:yes stop_codon:yes gene_type:complete